MRVVTGPSSVGSGGMNQLTGDVTAGPGTGSQVATIPAGAVTTAKLAAGAVGATQLAAGAVGTAQLANGAVGAGQLAAGAVGTTQLANGAVGAGQLAAGAVGTTQLAAGSVTPAILAAGAGGLFSGNLSAVPTLANTGLSTPVNIGTGNIVDSSAGVIWTGPPGASSDGVRGYSAPYTPSATWANTMLLSFLASGSVNGYAEIGFTDGTKFITTRGYPNGGGLSFDVLKWTNSTTINGTLVAGSGHNMSPGIPCMPTWFRIRDDNVNLYWDISPDGKNWTNLGSIGRTAFTAAPTAWFFGANSFDAGAVNKLTLLSSIITP